MAQRIRTRRQCKANRQHIEQVFNGAFSASLLNTLLEPFRTGTFGEIWANEDSRMRSMRCSLETVAMIVCGLYTNPLKIASPARKSALTIRPSGSAAARAIHCSNHAASV